MYDARDLANLMLDQADDLGFGLSNMSINKLLYFLVGTYLADYSQSLMRDEFEAWDYGPVVPRVYSCFKHHGSGQVTSRANRYDPVTQKLYYVEYQIDADHIAYSNYIVSAYGRFDAYHLSCLSHETGTAWSNAYKQGKLKERTHSIIKKADIAVAFENLSQAIQI